MPNYTSDLVESVQRNIRARFYDQKKNHTAAKSYEKKAKQKKFFYITTIFFLSKSTLSITQCPQFSFESIKKHCRVYLFYSYRANLLCKLYYLTYPVRLLKLQQPFLKYARRERKKHEFELFLYEILVNKKNILHINLEKVPLVIKSKQRMTLSCSIFDNIYVW